MKLRLLICLLSLGMPGAFAQSDQEVKKSDTGPKIINAAPVKLSPQKPVEHKTVQREILVTGSPAEGGPEIRSHKATLSPRENGQRTNQGRAVTVGTGKVPAGSKVVRNLSAPLVPAPPAGKSANVKRIISEP